MQRRSVLGGLVAVIAGWLAGMRAPESAAAVAQHGEFLSPTLYVRAHGDTFGGLGYATFPLLPDGTIDIHNGMFIHDAVVVGWAELIPLPENSNIDDPVNDWWVGPMQVVSAQPMDEFAATAPSRLIDPWRPSHIRVYFI